MRCDCISGDQRLSGDSSTSQSVFVVLSCAGPSRILEREGLPIGRIVCGPAKMHGLRKEKNGRKGSQCQYWVHDMKGTAKKEDVFRAKRHIGRIMTDANDTLEKRKDAKTEIREEVRLAQKSEKGTSISHIQLPDYFFLSFYVEKGG